LKDFLLKKTQEKILIVLFLSIFGVLSEVLSGKKSLGQIMIGYGDVPQNIDWLGMWTFTHKKIVDNRG
jgi:hypothetical protein